MGRPLLLYDVFSGAGGAAAGYDRAGFRVVGIDNRPQKNYPFDFVQMEAFAFFDAVQRGEFEVPAAWHASPPCQRYTALRSMWNAREHPDLVAPTRSMLKAAGLPYVIENVPGAPLEGAITLCGSMFRLGCDGAELQRHRLFETSFPLTAPCPCDHGWSARERGEAEAERITVGVYEHAGGESRRAQRTVIGVYGGHGRDRRRRTNGQHFSTAARAEAMGIDWMTGNELSQAIPPAYTAFIGTQLRMQL